MRLSNRAKARIEKILVFGANGQIGRELEGVWALGRDEADLENPEACERLIEEFKGRAVINAAAYTRVDQAEDEEGLAQRVNGNAPRVMATASAARGLPFVHISTDYVFEGSGDRPWQADDPVAPQNAYGCSKLLGEKGVEAAGGSFVIMRTSWVFSAHGANFVKTMLRLGRERDALNIVDDQIGGPTAARDIAKTCYRIADQLVDAPEKSGIYHYSGAPDVSWADFACEIFEQARIDCKVDGIASKDYPTPAKRPLNSRLYGVALSKRFGIERPDWRISLGEVLDELNATE